MAQRKPEHRSVLSEFETRDLGNDKAIIAGYAAVFDRDSQPLFDWNRGMFIEQFRQGSFKKTIQEADVRGLFNHQTGLVLGRTSAGTLRLSEDERGLHYELDADLGNTDVRNLYRQIERGDIAESSIGFIIPTGKDEWNYEDEPIRRTVHEAKLVDVSPVVFAAYLDTTSQTREALRGLARDADRPLDELVAAAQGGELRSYLHSPPANTEPDTTPEEPVEDHSEKREVVHSMPPSVRLALIEAEEDNRTTGAA